MTDQVTQESYPVPDPTVVDPCPATVRNGQCAPDGFTNHNHQQAKTPTEPESFTVGQEMKITDTVEGEGLLESSMRLKPHEAQNYRKKALWVSWLSIVVTLILAVAAFSETLLFFLPYLFDATLDVMSSAIVLWRYSNAAAVHSAHREYIACVVLGVVFVLSSICILGKAIHDLATRMPPKVDDFLFSVSIVSGLTCAVLAVAKFMLGRVLTSRALITDGRTHTHTHTDSEKDVMEEYPPIKEVFLIILSPRLCVLYNKAPIKRKTMTQNRRNIQELLWICLSWTYITCC
uniref:Transmembrane protein 163a n=1 Tax=Neolamprologus brichardi TaxID=32507 RepID=A0A3Q4HBE1_NEOBR